MIVIAGEALIDLIERPQTVLPSAQGEGERSGATPALFFAHHGGGPFNTAIALGRLQQDVGYVYPISHDRFGRELARQLQEAGVHHLIPQPSRLGTPLALVQLDERGQASYRFYRQGTADRDITAAALVAALPPVVDFFVTGTLAIAEEPDVSVLSDVIAAARARDALICVDPNLRPKAYESKTPYLDNVKRICARADIIKASSDDLAVLYPDIAPEHAATHLQQQSGAALVVITAGADGALAYTDQTSIAVAAYTPAAVVDTIGAGDTFLGGLLYGLGRHRIASRAALASLAASDLAEILNLASVAAGLNCAGAGCNPPTLNALLAVCSQGPD